MRNNISGPGEGYETYVLKSLGNLDEQSDKCSINHPILFLRTSFTASKCFPLPSFKFVIL